MIRKRRFGLVNGFTFWLQTFPQIWLLCILVEVANVVVQDGTSHAYFATSSTLVGVLLDSDFTLVFALNVHQEGRRFLAAANIVASWNRTRPIFTHLVSVAGRLLPGTGLAGNRNLGIIGLAGMVLSRGASNKGQALDD